MGQSTSTTSETPRAERIWLDELPQDICNRIASFVTRFEDESPGNLAKASETQREAVKHAYCYSLNLYDMGFDEYTEQSNEMLRSDVATLLRHDVREIRTCSEWLRPKYIQACLKSPALVRMYVYVESRLNYGILLYARNLRSLELKFFHFDDITPALQKLSILDLRELTLETHITACLHRLLTETPRDRFLLALYFPLLEKLSLACRECGIRDTSGSSYLWQAMERFNGLKEVTICEPVPGDAIKKFRQMETVNLRCMNAISLAMEIPDRIVHLSTLDFQTYGYCTSGVTLGREDLKKLADCRRLERLDCCIARGAETSLVQVMRNLRCCVISFKPEEEFGVSWYQNRQHEPIPNAFLNAVKSARFLKSIRLCNMRVRRTEVREILMVLGKQLEVYEEDTVNLGESPSLEKDLEELDELTTTLRTAALYSPSLRIFTPLLRFDFAVTIEREEGALPRQPEFTTAMRLCRTAIRVLGRRAPLLDMRVLMKQFHQ